MLTLVKLLNLLLDLPILDFALNYQNFIAMLQIAEFPF